MPAYNLHYGFASAREIWRARFGVIGCPVLLHAAQGVSGILVSAWMGAMLIHFPSRMGMGSDGGHQWIGHPLWTLRQSGYTPGVIIAPLLLALAVYLALQLRRIARALQSEIRHVKSSHEIEFSLRSAV